MVALWILCCRPPVVAADGGVDPRALHGQARFEAGRGRCDRAGALTERVRAAEPAYYRDRIAIDPALARCAGRGAAVLPLERRRHRIGIDVGLSAGGVMTAGGGIRYEHPLGEKLALVGRAIGLVGAVVEAEDDGFDAAVAQIGIRRYASGRAAYLMAEGGLAAIRIRAYTDLDDRLHGVDWKALPSAQLGAGLKLGRVDLALSGWFPFLGVGLQLGYDLGAF